METPTMQPVFNDRIFTGVDTTTMPFDVLALIPMAQEMYMFCFFCIGFAIFRSEKLQRVFSWQQLPLSPKKIEEDEPHPTYSATQACDDLGRARFDHIVRGWPFLDDFTEEAFAAVITAFIFSGRPDSIGYFVLAASQKRPHLVQSLGAGIKSVVSLVKEVNRHDIAAALRSIHEHVLVKLDVTAAEELLVGFATLNDEPSVSAVLARLNVLGAPATRDLLVRATRGFLANKNCDASLRYLDQALSPKSISTGSSAAQVPADLIVAVVRCATEAVIADDDADVPPLALRAIEVLETADGVPVESLVILAEWSARQSLGDVVAAERVEHILRRVCQGDLPDAACEAFVRAHAGLQGNSAKAMACFDELVTRSSTAGLAPSERSFVGMISACLESQNGILAEHIVRGARRCGRCSLLVFSCAVKVLTASKSPERICALYEDDESETLVLDDALYGQLIKAAVHAGQLNLARKIFKRSRNPDVQNYMSLIRACGQEGDVAQALELLGQLRERGEADVSACNCALDVCVSTGDLQAARRLFDEMLSGGQVDVVSFNILLKLCSSSGERDTFSADVDALVETMRRCGLKPNTATYNSILSGAMAVGDFSRAWRTIGCMENCSGSIDAFTITILFRGYRRERQVIDARTFDRVMELLKRHSVKIDDVLVNAALEACGCLRDPAKLISALEMFEKGGWVASKQCAMHTRGLLIKAYGQSGLLDTARKVWSEATHDVGASEQLYGQMIDVLVSNDCLDDALSLFEKMKHDHRDHITSRGFSVAYAMIIRGFAQRKECHRALRCYEEMKHNGVEIGVVVFNTLIDACSRVGDIDAAASVFRDMLRVNCGPDLITYSTLIKGYCVRGEIDKAMELFALMRKKGITPDAIVFNSLLDGCAKKQMPAACERVMKEMEEASITPSNHSVSILVKLYGRCGDVDAAFRVFEEMPQKYGFKANVAVYTCLMSTCIGNGRLDLAMDLHARMIHEGTYPDEKTYSTLLRGALKVGVAENCSLLLRTALQQRGSNRGILDVELTQSALNLIQRKRLWDTHGRELLDQLRSSGVAVHYPRQQQPQQQQPQPQKQQKQQKQQQQQQQQQQEQQQKQEKQEQQDQHEQEKQEVQERQEQQEQRQQQEQEEQQQHQELTADVLQKELSQLKQIWLQVEHLQQELLPEKRQFHVFPSVAPHGTHDQRDHKDDFAHHQHETQEEEHQEQQQQQQRQQHVQQQHQQHQQRLRQRLAHELRSRRDTGLPQVVGTVVAQTGNNLLHRTFALSNFTFQQNRENQQEPDPLPLPREQQSFKTPNLQTKLVHKQALKHEQKTRPEQKYVEQQQQQQDVQFQQQQQQQQRQRQEQEQQQQQQQQKQQRQHEQDKQPQEGQQLHRPKRQQIDHPVSFEERFIAGSAWTNRVDGRSASFNSSGTAEDNENFSSMAAGDNDTGELGTKLFDHMEHVTPALCRTDEIGERPGCKSWCRCGTWDSCNIYFQSSVDFGDIEMSKMTDVGKCELRRSMQLVLFFPFMATVACTALCLWVIGSDPSSAPGGSNGRRAQRRLLAHPLLNSALQVR
eukprot:TRINITY_DN11086_c1_g1_i7.p1 TRINITY_DN11086_c1_g1~~TRINITY_DN11086_c1_g1_i7.p1  ORF type:complete len:1555 (+),score=374.19 TRINITY_DN11086_c1_g1_i7:77-4741(+)